MRNRPSKRMGYYRLSRKISGFSSRSFADVRAWFTTSGENLTNFYDHAICVRNARGEARAGKLTVYCENDFAHRHGCDCSSVGLRSDILAESMHRWCIRSHEKYVPVRFASRQHAARNRPSSRCRCRSFAFYARNRIAASFDRFTSPAEWIRQVRQESAKYRSPAIVGCAVVVSIGFVHASWPLPLVKLSLDNLTFARKRRKMSPVWKHLKFHDPLHFVRSRKVDGGFIDCQYCDISEFWQGWILCVVDAEIQSVACIKLDGVASGSFSVVVSFIIHWENCFFSEAGTGEWLSSISPRFISIQMRRLE